MRSCAGGRSAATPKRGSCGSPATSPSTPGGAAAAGRHRRRHRAPRRDRARSRRAARRPPPSARHASRAAEREVIVLRFLADLPEADVAKALGCSVGSVKQHASRGLAALRTAMAASTTRSRSPGALMPNLIASDLRDPSPPVPGERERAAVAARAHQLGRRRRIMQGAGALGMVAAVAVGVAALTAGGSSRLRHQPHRGGQLERRHRRTTASRRPRSCRGPPVTTARRPPRTGGHRRPERGRGAVPLRRPRPAERPRPPRAGNGVGHVSTPGRCAGTVPLNVTMAASRAGRRRRHSRHRRADGTDTGTYRRVHDGTASQTGRVGASASTATPTSASPCRRPRASRRRGRPTRARTIAPPLP